MAKKVYLGMIADIMHPGLINIINEGAKYGDVIMKYEYLLAMMSISRASLVIICFFLKKKIE